MHWRRKWQPTPVFLPGESQGRGSLVGDRGDGGGGAGDGNYGGDMGCDAIGDMGMLEVMWTMVVAERMEMRGD